MGIRMIFVIVVGGWGVIGSILMKLGKLRPGFFGYSPLGILLCGLGLATFALHEARFGEAAGAVTAMGGALIFGAGAYFEWKARRGQTGR